MKSIINLINEKQNFLVNGHSKNQKNQIHKKHGTKYFNEQDIEDLAQLYLDKYGSTSKFHEKQQNTSTYDLFEKAVYNGDKGEVIEVMAAMAEMLKLRTMDIMGICGYITHADDADFEKLYG